MQRIKEGWVSNYLSNLDLSTRTCCDTECYVDMMQKNTGLMQQLCVSNFLEDCVKIKLKLLKHTKKHYSCMDCY